MPLILDLTRLLCSCPIAPNRRVDPNNRQSDDLGGGL
jgi:hypothetical protein